MTDSLGAGKVKPSKTRTHSDWGKILADYGKAHNPQDLHQNRVRVLANMPVRAKSGKLPRTAARSGERA